MKKKSSSKGAKAKKSFLKNFMKGFKKVVGGTQKKTVKITKIKVNKKVKVVSRKSTKKIVKPVKKVLKARKQLIKSKKMSAKVKQIPLEKFAMPDKVEPTDIIVFEHVPVLVQEVLENLQLDSKKTVVDGTLGLGGHSKSMLELMGTDARLIGFDVDEDNMARAQQRLGAYGERVVLVRSNFGNLQAELAKLKIKSVDAILLDLGLSSPQVDNPVKGFSFLREGPLDMRFDKSASLTAADVINSYSGAELQRIFFEFGEERFARKIAAEIVKRRKARSFKTTTELANFIEKLMGRQGHLHPATRVFQALRIEVNHELDVLMNVLKQAEAVLKKGGRIAVIAYHSLEDRVVKQFLKERARDFINEPDKLTTTHLKPTFGIVTKKPLVPTEAEIHKNPRSRSAKLRVAQKL